mmetsp:Transcript_18147/g.30267  ORF Transcript_18147/g.30267 Transcript_18147/m.30267 type:complete len:494 (-) Transcript_18147:260-1741(-)
MTPEPEVIISDRATPEPSTGTVSMNGSLSQQTTILSEEPAPPEQRPEEDRALKRRRSHNRHHRRSRATSVVVADEQQALTGQSEVAPDMNAEKKIQPDVQESDSKGKPLRLEPQVQDYIPKSQPLVDYPLPQPKAPTMNGLSKRPKTSKAAPSPPSAPPRPSSPVSKPFKTRTDIMPTPAVQTASLSRPSSPPNIKPARSARGISEGGSTSEVNSQPAAPAPAFHPSKPSKSVKTEKVPKLPSSLFKTLTKPSKPATPIEPSKATISQPTTIPSKVKSASKAPSFSAPLPPSSTDPAPTAIGASRLFREALGMGVSPSTHRASNSLSRTSSKSKATSNFDVPPPSAVSPGPSKPPPSRVKTSLLAFSDDIDDIAPRSKKLKAQVEPSLAISEDAQLIPRHTKKDSPFTPTGLGSKSHGKEGRDPSSGRKKRLSDEREARGEKRRGEWDRRPEDISRSSGLPPPPDRYEPSPDADVEDLAIRTLSMKKKKRLAV